MIHIHNKKRSPYLSPLEKLNAILRTRQGESKAAVARSIDVPESTLRGWFRKENKLRCLAFATYVEERNLRTIQHNSALDTDASNTIEEPLNKMKKLDTSPNSAPSYMTVKQESSDVVDLSNYNQSQVPLQYNGMGQGKTTSDSSSKGLMKYEDNRRRIYGADVRTNDENKSAISVTPASPMSSHNGMSSNVQSPHSLSYQEIDSNLNSIARVNTQSNSIREITKADENGALSSMTQSVNQPMSASNYRCPSTSAGPCIQQQQQQEQQQNHLQNMVPTTSTLPILSSTPRKTTSTQPLGDENSALFMQWCNYNQLLAAMASDKSKGINHNNAKPKYLTKEMNSMSPTTSNNHFFNYTSSPEELSKFNPRFNPVTQSIKTEMEYTVSSSTLSPIPPLVEIGDKKEVIVHNGGSSNSSGSTSSNSSGSTSSNSSGSTSSNTSCNSTEKANGISESDSDLIGLVEAITYGEKFLKWLEAYSDPTLTTQDLLQFQRLLQKMKEIAERENSPTVGSTKSRRK